MGNQEPQKKKSKEMKTGIFHSLNKEHKIRLFLSTSIITLLCLSYLAISCSNLFLDKQKQKDLWDYQIHSADKFTESEKDMCSDAVKVTAGTNILYFKSIDLKNSSYSLVFNIWFKWIDDDSLDMIDNFSVENGTIDKMYILEDNTTNQHTSEYYQLAEVHATVSKSFSTRRFPLSSYQIQLHIEPVYDITRVVLVPDNANSNINTDLRLSGFSLNRHDVNIYVNRHKNTYGDPKYENAPYITSQLLTSVEINRTSYGLYFKCVIAIMGTSLWVLIPLFVCIYRREHTLVLIPPVFIGAVTNIMVGANLLPDALEAGLIEYVNIWGIMVIFVVTLVILHVDYLRNRYLKDEYATCFGVVMFFIMLFLILLGYILLPLSAINI